MRGKIAEQSYLATFYFEPLLQTVAELPQLEIQIKK